MTSALPVCGCLLNIPTYPLPTCIFTWHTVIFVTINMQTMYNRGKKEKKKKERHKGCITELDEPAHWKTWHEISKHCNTQGPNDTEQWKRFSLATALEYVTSLCICNDAATQKKVHFFFKCCQAHHSFDKVNSFLEAFRYSLALTITVDGFCRNISLWAMS